MRAACVAKVAALGAELEQSMLQLLDLRAAGGAELQEQWQQLSDKTAAAEARAKEMENELAVANDSVSELQTSLLIERNEGWRLEYVESADGQSGCKYKPPEWRDGR